VSVVDVPTVYRHVDDTDHEHAARVDGFDAGWRHQNFVTAYGPTTDTTVPTRFEDVADVWRTAYEEGQDDFTSSWEEAESYGHDWRQHEPVERD
jgi:hypothetical protein